MAVDRNKSFEVRSDGLTLEGGAHLSSASSSPTHSGLKGDWYFKTSDFSLWFLEEDGTGWKKLYASSLSLSPDEFMQAKAYISGSQVIFIQYDFLINQSLEYLVSEVC